MRAESGIFYSLYVSSEGDARKNSETDKRVCRLLPRAFVVSEQGKAIYITAQYELCVRMSGWCSAYACVWFGIILCPCFYIRAYIYI